ncbi:hypothetical protein EV361DRAFT_810106 [Lentinula raphanica]|nr:hypothetical protein EV361DRAFT_810106 [Lentinula raphanica]
MAITALGLVLCLARNIFHLIYRVCGGLASACWKFVYLLTFLSLVVLPLLSTMDSVLRPLCLIPRIANISLCSKLHSVDYESQPLWADFPRLMNAQSSTFEQLLDNSVGGSSISLDIKKAEMAMSDLVVPVKYSKLSSKDVMHYRFAHDARRTGRGLQTLGSKIGGAVDLVLSVNEYAMAKLGSTSSSSSSSFISQALVPFQSLPSLEMTFLLSFAESMNTLSTVIQRLILLAEIELSNLDRLEEHLSLIHEIVAREDSSIANAKSELLGEIWTWLGGNQRELSGHNAHLKLLRGIGGFRNQALAHVVSALQILRSLSDDMENMRERMVMPDLVGTQIPLEVQVSSIQHGLQRLRDSKALARKREDVAIRMVTGLEG